MKTSKILIVEDEAIIAYEMRLKLLVHGYEVFPVINSGEQAIETVKKIARPDLIIMDVQLKGSMDGIEAALEILKENSIPIIFVTGNMESLQDKRLDVHSWISALPKPPDDDVLISTMHRMLEQQEIEL